MSILTDEDIKRHYRTAIKASFRAMDENGDNRISVSEFRKAAKKLGQDVTVAEVNAMFKEVDENGDGFLSYKEFEGMMVDRMEAAALEEKFLREMFSQMDIDRNGRVSYKELAKTMGISKEEAKELIKEADTSGDGKINFEEFAAVYRKEDTE